MLEDGFSVVARDRMVFSDVRFQYHRAFSRRRPWFLDVGVPVLPDDLSGSDHRQRFLLPPPLLVCAVKDDGCTVAGVNGRQVSCGVLCATSVVGLSRRVPFLVALLVPLFLVLTSLRCPRTSASRPWPITWAGSG